MNCWIFLMNKKIYRKREREIEMDQEWIYNPNMNE